MSTPRHTLLAVLIGALAALAGCESDSPVTQNDQCPVDADCGGARLCEQGQCIDVDGNNVVANNGRVDSDDGTNNGTNTGTNNGGTNNSTNNGGTNNGTTTNGGTNNGGTNNGGTNNGDTNNGTNNTTNNGTIPCEPVEEVCDGEDNDCDRAVDEGVTNACGGCGEVPVEVCDGEDNDCDGAVDEDVTNACGGCGAVLEEVCNGVDDNCDGQTDEGVANACGTCGPVPVEICDGQDNDCDGQTDEDVTNACGGCGQVPVEVCDGQDNDCDGQTDEDVTNACGGCGDLGGAPGNLCGTCGVLACSGDGTALACDDPGANACGSCGALDAEPGAACGTCGEVQCASDGGIRCVEGTENICGGCGPITGDPGAVCGACGFDALGCTPAGTLECIETIGCPEGWVRVEAGSFQMGSPGSEPGRARGNEERQHMVTLTRPFMVLDHEVTQGMWADIAGGNPSSNDGCGADCPVEDVDWWEAIRFANTMSIASGLEPCYQIELNFGIVSDFRIRWSGLDCEGYRLPTEAEWEYAARAGAGTAFTTGDYIDGGGLLCNRDGSGHLAAAGWYCDNANNLRSVAQKASNAWGLVDVSGNVAEWVWDARSDYPNSAVVDPTGGLEVACDSVIGGCARVVRGGSFASGAADCRLAARGTQGSWAANGRHGFRLVRTLPVY